LYNRGSRRGLPPAGRAIEKMTIASFRRRTVSYTPATEYNRGSSGGLNNKNASDGARSPYGTNSFDESPGALIGASHGKIGNRSRANRVFAACSGTLIAAEDAPESLSSRSARGSPTTREVTEETTETFFADLSQRSMFHPRVLTCCHAAVRSEPGGSPVTDVRRVFTGISGRATAPVTHNSKTLDARR